MSLHKIPLLVPDTFAKAIYIVTGLCVLTPFISAPLALCSGIILAFLISNPFENLTRKYTKKLLALSIIGLGAGMNLKEVLQTGIQGLYLSAMTIAVTIFFGIALYKIIKTDRDICVLITIGTAICGGSAIAAIAPVIKANDRHITVALAIIFILNALALFTFPWLGHIFALSEPQFGIWSALAIHDTSSIIGAGMVYGPQALETATTIKLVRTLWIIPIVLITAYIYSRNKLTSEKRGVPIPWFIGGFLMMAALVTWLPGLQSTGLVIEQVARRLLVLTLFLIGTGLTVTNLKNVGLRPFVLGILLWLIIAGATLAFIKTGYAALL